MKVFHKLEAGELPVKSQTGSPDEHVFRSISHWVFVAALFAIIVVVFLKTCFAGASLSRLCVLAEWDSVFDQWRTGRPQPYDPSLVQIFLPDFVFLAQNLCKGIFPLWNPYCGLGYPFVADIQSCVFAPLRVIFNFIPNLTTYNYFLVSEIVVCAIASYLLTFKLLYKSVGNKLLLQLCSLFAAVCYTFCPYNLWYLEISPGTSAALFPLTALGFVYASEKRTVGSAILAGLASAVLILSGHPECAFFGIALSAILMILLVSFQPSGNLPGRVASSLKLLLIAAISTVALSAPALFPFVEYLLNGQSYKYGSAYSTPVTVNGILFNLSNPGQNGASPYLGIIAALLIPAALFGLRRSWSETYKTAALLFLTVATFILVSQLGPVQAIFSNPPLTAIITRYALPYLLLLFSILAAAGLFELCTATQRADVKGRLSRIPGKDQPPGNSGKDRPPGSTRRTFIPDSQSSSGAPVQELAGFQPASIDSPPKAHVNPLILLFSLSAIAIALHYFPQSVASNSTWLKIADFDAMLPTTAFNLSAWKRDLICTGIFLAITFVCFCNSGLAKIRSKFLDISTGSFIAITALILGFISIASVAKFSLPQQSKFFYPQTELIAKLKDEQHRCISTCEYVMRPSTNAVYGINFLTFHSPLFPGRFLEFLKACGAETDIFNQKFSKQLSPLLNLASVKYVLSIEPISDLTGDTSRFILSYRSKNNISLYENRDAAPRAYLVPNASYATSAEDSLAKITSANFDPHSSVVIESTTLKNKVDSISKTKYTQVDKFTLPDPNHIKITCHSDSPSWLVLTDIFYPGWTAYIDGKATRIERANYAFRAIKLPAGEHNIEFSFEPLSFKAACVVLALFLIITAWCIRSRAFYREV